jgi:hypothetical protein
METWLPIITLALGWAAGLATEALRDRRAREREREALRAEHQRATLMDLQVALEELHTRTSDLIHARMRVRSEPEITKQEMQEKEWEARNRRIEIRAKVSLLATRVEDEEARDLVLGYTAAVVRVAPGLGDFLGEVGEPDLFDMYMDATERLGELLRQTY